MSEPLERLIRMRADGLTNSDIDEVEGWHAGRAGSYFSAARLLGLEIPEPSWGGSDRPRSHCKRGHPLVGANISLAAGGKQRHCLACRRIRAEKEKNRQANHVR